MRRKDKERDAAFAWQVMAEAPYATLSLVDGEGRPYAVPVSQAAWPEGECIYFHCAIGGKKYEIFENGCEAVMSAVSRTEIVLGQYTVAYASAIARGRLEIIADPEERMHAMAVLCRQFDPAAGEKYVGCMQRMGARTCLVRLAVEEITGKENLFFSQEAHGILDGDCLKKASPGEARTARRISQVALYTMQYIVSSPMTKLYSFTVTDEVLWELERHIQPYVAGNTDKKFKSLQILEVMM